MSLQLALMVGAGVGTLLGEGVLRQFPARLPRCDFGLVVLGVSMLVSGV